MQYVWLHCCQIHPPYLHSSIIKPRMNLYLSEKNILDQLSSVFYCVLLVDHRIWAHLLFGPISGFLLATLMYRESLLLHNTFLHPVFPECDLLWASGSIPLGTTASLYEPPPYPRNNSSTNVHLYGYPVGRYSSLP